MTDQYFFAIRNMQPAPTSPKPKDEKSSSGKPVVEEEHHPKLPVDQAEAADNSPTVIATLRKRLTKGLQSPPGYEEEEAGFWLDD